jgi:DNA (cytosine-5)-methyltransferase 1
MKWSEVFEMPILKEAIRELSSEPEDHVRMKVASLLSMLSGVLRVRADPGIGSDRKRFHLTPMRGLEKRSMVGIAKWFRDREPEVLANHETKAHMPSDLLRYFFVATYGKVAKASPRLNDFPQVLLPEHKNVDRENPGATIFKDRFRVQLESGPSMTVTSHMAKDGHAFIHFDPLQCRSLTVREAARLQTFPDSYVFLGNKTSQYTQVGNAVPPYLAMQIADVVGSILQSAGMAGSAARTESHST